MDFIRSFAISFILTIVCIMAVYLEYLDKKPLEEVENYKVIDCSKIANHCEVYNLIKD